MPTDDKKRRGIGQYRNYINVGVLAAVALYLAFGSHSLGQRGASLLQASAGAAAPTEQQVPVPVTPRSVIRYFDGNTVVT